MCLLVTGRMFCSLCVQRKYSFYNTVVFIQLELKSGENDGFTHGKLEYTVRFKDDVTDAQQ